jgi:hypothetical protein
MLFALFLTILATHFLNLPWWTPLAVIPVVWLVCLPVTTWRDYLAAMTLDRIEHGCEVTLPAEDERCLEPDHVRVVRWFLWPGAALKNFTLAQLVCIFYFRTLPKPKLDVGLTRLLNRMVRTGGWRQDRARAIQKRWLDRADRRGKHY